MSNYNEWWEQAKRDLRAARSNLLVKEYNISSFQSQQAAEKALKALILKNNNRLPKEHDLVLLANKSKLPENMIQLCKDLTPVYVETRYPDVNGFKQYTKEESEEDIKMAEEILRWVEKNI